jgi:maltose-binding protein MalE
VARRQTLGGLLVAGIALLSGCSEARSTRSLVIWHPWGGAELSALRQAIARYRESHPGLDIVSLPVPSDKLQDKYLRSTAANGGPDLVIGATDWIGKLAQSEVIAPLEDVLDEETRGRIRPFALEALRYQGHLYAIPESLETVALYYNKRLVSQLPRNLAELTIRANSRDYWKGDFLLAYNTQFYFSAGYLFGRGAALLGQGDDVRVDSPEAVRWLTWLRDLKANPAIAAKSDYGRADGLFRDGKAAMTVNGMWALRDYQAALGKDLGVATLPEVEPGRPASPFVGIKCVMVNPNGGRSSVEKALEFARFLISPGVAGLMMDVAGHVPVVRDVAFSDTDVLAPFARQAEVGTALPAAPEMREVWGPMDQAIEKVMTDVASPDVAIREAQSVIAAKIEAVRNP